MPLASVRTPAATVQAGEEEAVEVAGMTPQSRARLVPNPGTASLSCPCKWSRPRVMVGTWRRASPVFGSSHRRQICSSEATQSSAAMARNSLPPMARLVEAKALVEAVEVEEVRVVCEQLEAHALEVSENRNALLKVLTQHTLTVINCNSRIKQLVKPSPW